MAKSAGMYLYAVMTIFHQGLPNIRIFIVPSQIDGETSEHKPIFIQDCFTENRPLVKFTRN